MSLGRAGGPAPGQGTWAARAQTGSPHPRGGRERPTRTRLRELPQTGRLSEIATGSRDIQLAWAACPGMTACG